MKTYVLIQRGKSVDRPDKVELKEFDTHEQAEGFCEVNTNTESKYWTYCEIIEPNKELELYYNNC